VSFHLLVGIFVLLVPTKWLVRRPFLHQSNDWLGRSSSRWAIMCQVGQKGH